MKRTIIFVIVCLVMLGSTQGAIVHRYAFDGDPNDSVGTANGVLVRNLDALLLQSRYENGQLILGNNGTQASNAAGGTSDGDYVDLPNGIISVLGDQATFEVWTTWRGSAMWERIFDIGTSDGGENTSGGAPGSYYIFLTPRGGSEQLRLGMNKPVPTREERTINDPAGNLPTNAEQHIVISWDGARQSVKMFRNGALVDQGQMHFALSDIPDINNWLGRSQWPDTMYVGSYNEFRIYDHAMSDSEVAASLEAGTEVSPASPVYPANLEKEVAPLATMKWAPGYIPSGSSVPTYKVYLSADEAAVTSRDALETETGDTSHTLSVPLEKNGTYFWCVDQTVILPGRTEPNDIRGGVVSFETEKTLPVLSLPRGAHAEPGDPASITVAIQSDTDVHACQWFKYVEGVGDVEMAGDSVSIDCTNTATTLTIDPVGMGDEGEYYCIVTNDAGASSSADIGLIFLDVRYGLIHRYSFTTDPNDSVGNADGVLMGEAVIDAGSVVFNRTVGTYVDLPPHMLDGLTGVTFMVWVNKEANEWSRIFDFGDRAEGGAGINYFFLAPTGRFAIKDGATEQAVDGTIPINSVSQVTCVYDADGSSNVMRLYIDGQLVGQRANCFPMSVVNDVHCWLGQSGYSWDPWFLGSIDEFRIFDTPLNAGWVEAYYEAGPDALPTDACVARPLYDVGGIDCVVDISDFSAFALTWLECGLDSCQ